ncbi:MAG: permease-like cell division protein FtsX [Clostridia bacterium]|nr:permease-like cell division protein FtsX [Clostridia bacterium]
MKSLGYSIKQGLLQIGRNKAMSFASVVSITAMLIILGVFFTVSVNLNMFTETVKGDYSLIEVFMKDGAGSKTIKADMKAIEKMDGVQKVDFRSKKEALKIMKERWGESAYLLENLGSNPLPNSILVTLGDLDKGKTIVENVSGMKGVEDVSFFQETVDKITKFAGFIKTGSLIIMAFLVLVSMLVVSNTIKLTVFARKSEIFIMKYVGATNWFVRGPFLAEGIIIGMISAVLASGLTALIYEKVIDLVGADLFTMLSTSLMPTGVMMSNLIIIFLSIGVSIGALGSIVSLRRFLDKRG